MLYGAGHGCMHQEADHVHAVQRYCFSGLWQALLDYVGLAAVAGSYLGALAVVTIATTPIMTVNSRGQVCRDAFHGCSE